MTDRERWIVYPLLFMALLYGFINAIERQAERKGSTSSTSLEVDTIHCRELSVLNDSGKVVARMKVGSDDAGLIEAANRNGVWQVILTANSTSGVMGLLDSTGQSVLQIPALGHATPQQSTDANRRESDPTADRESKK